MASRIPQRRQPQPPHPPPPQPGGSLSIAPFPHGQAIKLLQALNASPQSNTDLLGFFLFPIGTVGKIRNYRAIQVEADLAASVSHIFRLRSCFFFFSIYSKSFDRPVGEPKTSRRPTAWLLCMCIVSSSRYSSQSKESTPIWPTMTASIMTTCEVSDTSSWYLSPLPTNKDTVCVTFSPFDSEPWLT